MLNAIPAGEAGFGPCEGCGEPIPRVRHVLRSGRVVWPLAYQPCPDCGIKASSWEGQRRIDILKGVGLHGVKEARWSFDRLDIQSEESDAEFIRRIKHTEHFPFGLLSINVAILRGVYDWLKRPTDSVYLCGDVGQGKSVMACAMVDRLMMPEEISERRLNDDEMRAIWGHKWDRVPESRRYRRGVPKPRSVLFTSWNDLMWRITTKYKSLDPDALGKVSKVGVLFIDDLGTWEGVDAKKRELAVSALEALIEYRYKHERPVVITSNLPFESLRDHYSLRVHDRLNEMCGTRVYQFRGPSWRGVR